MPDLSYHNQRDILNTNQLREMLPQMPSFCAEFFRGITPETTPLTRINYARDLMIFFSFLCEYKACCKGKEIPAITTDDMAQITMTDIETYLDYLTVYAFSTENWKRSKEEVGALMQLILDFFASEIDELDEKNVRILILGDKAALPEKQRDTLIEAERRTAKNTGLHLNIALNYGGRAELTRAARLMAQEAAQGRLNPDEISEETVAQRLYTAGQPDVDLMIRTSGEMRLSNFLLWQCAYAEFEFPTVLWPDFTVADYDEALAAFGGRERRFGKRLS